MLQHQKLTQYVHNIQYLLWYFSKMTNKDFRVGVCETTIELWTLKRSKIVVCWFLISLQWGKPKSFHAAALKLVRSSAISQTLPLSSSSALDVSATFTPQLGLCKQAECKERWARVARRKNDTETQQCCKTDNTVTSLILTFNFLRTSCIDSVIVKVVIAKTNEPNPYNSGSNLAIGCNNNDSSNQQWCPTPDTWHLTLMSS